MKAKQRISIHGKRFKAGDDLSSLTAEELSLIPSFALDGQVETSSGASTNTNNETHQQTFKPINALNKAELMAFAGSIGVETTEEQTKAQIMTKINTLLEAVSDEIKGQSRDELIESLTAHYGDDVDVPDFAMMRDEELKIRLNQLLFVNMGRE